MPSLETATVKVGLIHYSVSDIVPVRQRGKSLALVTGSILPFTPYMLYAQVLASRANWRWTMWITL